MDVNQTVHPALLKFDPELNRIDDGGKELRDGISAAVLVGDTLWVACDETTRLDRLTRERGQRNDNCARVPEYELRLNFVLNFRACAV